MALTQAKIGRFYTIRNIWLPEAVARRLQMLGMTPGSVLAVLNNKRSGSIIIKVRGTRFALGKRFAQGIEVEECTHA